MFIHVHPYHTKPSCIPRWLMAAKASRLRKSTSMPHGRPSSIPQIPNVTKKVNKTESLIHVWATNLRTHCAWLQCGQSCIRSNKSFKFFSQKERPFPSLYFTGIVHWDKQVSRKLCYILGCRKSLCSALGRSSHPINSKSAPKNAEGRRLKRLLVTTADLSNWLSLLAFAAVRSTTAWVKDVKLPSVQVCVLAKWCKIPYQSLSDSVIQHTIHRFGGYLDMTFFHMKRKENECAQNHPPSLKSLPRVLSNQPNFSPTFTAEHGKPTPVVSCHLSNVIFITHLIRVITLFLV